MRDEKVILDEIDNKISKLFFETRDKLINTLSEYKEYEHDIKRLKHIFESHLKENISYEKLTQELKRLNELMQKIEYCKMELEHIFLKDA